MFAMTATRRLALAVAVLAASVVVQPVVQQAQAASEIAAVVNRTPITSTDVARRAAFLRLQRQKSDTKTAREAMVDEILKRQEIARVKMSVSTEDVDQAFQRFSASNKMTPQQMGQVLDRAGVGVEHFKNYIAVQMSWPRLVNARYGGARGRMSSQELVTRMMENKEKPVTTEYFLQQIIFVVPASKRNAILGKRQQEANASRSKFPGCDQSKQFAATMLDVSVRNLGRVLAPELPPDWADAIKSTKPGSATGVRETERGVEFIGVCSSREVSDDRVAQMVFQSEAAKDSNETDEFSKKYTEELRKKAKITQR